MAALDLDVVASSLNPDEIPAKLRCAGCSRFVGLNAFKLPCCDQSICDACKESLSSSCPVCDHRPLDPDDVIGSKALRMTAKAYLRGEAQRREKARKDKEALEAQTRSPPSQTNANPQTNSEQAFQDAQIAQKIYEEERGSNEPVLEVSEQEQNATAEVATHKSTTSPIGSSNETMIESGHQGSGEQGDSHHESRQDINKQDDKDLGTQAGQEEDTYNQQNFMMQQQQQQSMMPQSMNWNMGGMYNPMMAMSNPMAFSNMMGMGMDQSMMMSNGMFNGANMGMNGMNMGYNGGFGGGWNGSNGAMGMGSVGYGGDYGGDYSGFYPSNGFNQRGHVNQKPQYMNDYQQMRTRGRGHQASRGIHRGPSGLNGNSSAMGDPVVPHGPSRSVQEGNDVTDDQRPTASDAEHQMDTSDLADRANEDIGEGSADGAPVSANAASVDEDRKGQLHHDTEHAADDTAIVNNTQHGNVTTNNRDQIGSDTANESYPMNQSGVVGNVQAPNGPNAAEFGFQMPLNEIDLGYSNAAAQFGPSGRGFSGTRGFARGYGRGFGRGTPMRGGNRGGFHGPYSNAQDQFGVMPTDHSHAGQGVVGAPTGPKAMREGFPNVGFRIRGSGKFTQPAVSSSAGRQQSDEGRKASSQSVDVRDVHEKTQGLTVNEHKEDEPRIPTEPRAAQSHKGSNGPRETSGRAISVEESDRRFKDAERGTSRHRSRREEDRDEANSSRHRERSHSASRTRERDRSDGKRRRRRRHHRSRSRSPASSVEDSGHSRRQHGEQRRRHRSREPRRRSSRAEDEDNETGDGHARRGANGRDQNGSGASKRGDFKVKGLAARIEESAQRDKERDRRRASRDGGEDKRRDGEGGSKGAYVDAHALEREARNRERMLKEQQRRGGGGGGGGGGEAASSSSRKRSFVNAESLDLDDSHDDRRRGSHSHRARENESTAADHHRKRKRSRREGDRRLGDEDEARASRVENEREAARWR